MFTLLHNESLIINHLIYQMDCRRNQEPRYPTDEALAGDDSTFTAAQPGCNPSQSAPIPLAQQNAGSHQSHSASEQVALTQTIADGSATEQSAIAVPEEAAVGGAAVTEQSVADEIQARLLLGS